MENVQSSPTRKIISLFSLTETVVTKMTIHNDYTVRRVSMHSIYVYIQHTSNCLCGEAHILAQALNMSVRE